MASNESVAQVEINEETDLIGNVSDQDNDEDGENVWDDELLIKAYEKCTKKVEDILEEKNKSKTKLNKKSKNCSNVNWKIGQYCRAIYTVDGNEYEAQIKNIDQSKCTCIVKYVGYGNEEEHFLSGLLPSNGIASRKQQEISANVDPESTTENEIAKAIEVNHSDEISTNHLPKIKYPLIGPPPPNVLTNSNKPEDKALASMLMSWYMSGYHTGFYEGLRHQKK